MTRAETLLRQYRWQVEERRQRLGDLEQLAQKLRDEAQRLAAGAAPEAGLFLASWRQERRETIEQSLAAVEQELVESQEAVNAASQDLERYEVTAARHLMWQRERVDEAPYLTAKRAGDVPRR